MKCKFYSEEIGKRLFDGPPDVCPFEDNKDSCGCFEPHNVETTGAVGVGEYFNIGLTHTKCKKLILVGPEAEDSVELDSKKLSELNWININGIKFRGENNDASNNCAGCSRV